jgi:hypothetical protein
MESQGTQSAYAVRTTEDGFEIELTPFEIAAGTEIMRCTVVEGFSEDVMVQRASTTQAEGGHHVLLFTSSTVTPGEVFDCADPAVMGNFRFVAINKFDGTDDNIAFQIPASLPIVVQSHYVNASGQTVLGRDTYEVHRPSKGHPRRIDFWTVSQTGFLLDVGLTEMVTHCTLDSDLQVINHFGHMHELGEHYKFERTRPSAPVDMLDDYAWEVEYRDNAIEHMFTSNNPLVFATGDSITTTCRWNNTHGRPVEFPEEMCTTFGYYLVTDHRPGGFLLCTGGSFVVIP